MSDATTVASRALESGETTSEHKVMAEGAASGMLWAKAGTALALAPQALDALNWLPESVKNSKYGIIGIAVVGAVVGVCGIIQTLLLKLGYINGRSLLKAAAIRDVAPSTPVDAPKL